MKTLISKLFGQTSKDTDHNPALDIGVRIYCIGDIHGRLDLLQEVHAKINAHKVGYSGTCCVVYLGDYIDRGPHSKQVVDYLIDSPLSESQSVFLLGNHEQSILQFMYGSDLGFAHEWFRFGGIATLQSYEVGIKGIPTNKDIDAIRNELNAKCPLRHKQFFHTLELSFEIGPYYFVHAGVKPKVTLNKQSSEDLLWIREEFLDSTRNHGKIIVHGHTVTEKPEILANRIGLDTGAYASNNLTCAVFESDRITFL